MTIHAELNRIKRLSYKVANSSAKMELIQSVIANDNTFSKWDDVFHVFFDTRLKLSVTSELVRHQLSHYFNDDTLSLSCKADLVATLIFNYEDWLDVKAIAQEVWGEQYTVLIDQIEQHRCEREEFNKRLAIMDAQSSMDDILSVFYQVQQDIKKNK